MKTAKEWKLGSILINPHRFSVRYERGLSSKAGVVGVCGTDTLSILIDDDIAEGIEKETVLHEALHGIWAQTGLKDVTTTEIEEKIIWSLTPRILALLRDNIALREWLMKIDFPKDGETDAL